jgi:hypothetical protein
MALAKWLRAGRDEAQFARTWDVWWGDYAESQGFNVVVGAFEDFDDHVMLGYEDESVGESDATWSDDDEPDLAALESYGTVLVIGPCDTAQVTLFICINAPVYTVCHTRYRFMCSF